MNATDFSIIVRNLCLGLAALAAAYSVSAPGTWVWREFFHVEKGDCQ